MGFLDSGIGEGLNQATGTIAKTALNLAEFQQQARHMRALEDDSQRRLALEGQRVNMEVEQHEKKGKLVDMEIARKQKEDELIPIEESLTRLGFASPEEHKAFIEKLNPLEVENVGGVNYISRKAGVDNFQKLASDPEFNVSLGTIRMSNADKGIAQIDAQLNNPESKLKPEEIVALQKQRIGLVNQRTALANQVKLEQRKIKAKSIQNVPSGTETWDFSDPENPKKIASNEKQEKPLVIPEGSALMDESGKVIYKNTKTFNPKDGGKPTSLKFQNDYAKASAKRDELVSQMDDIFENANRLLKHPGLSRITGVMGAIPNIPGTKAADAQAALDSFKSKLGLTTLAALKSGTGAGLGQVTEAEHRLLQNFVSELDNAQSEQAIKQSMKRIQNWSVKAKERINKGYENSIYGRYDRSEDYSDMEKPATSVPKIGYVLKGYKFKGGNPADKNNWEKI